MNNIKLSPSVVYNYFLKQQKYISDRGYDKVLNNVLECIMASSIFEENDYELLFKQLRTRIQWHCNTEWHYRIAIENNNNSAWKSIELFLKRKPYLVDSKRVYDGFDFQLARNEYYRCTGWNEKGNIKFVLYSEPNNNGRRKLLNFNREQFNEYFKGKKIFQW